MTLNQLAIVNAKENIQNKQADNKDIEGRPDIYMTAQATATVFANVCDRANQGGDAKGQNHNIEYLKHGVCECQPED